MKIKILNNKAVKKILEKIEKQYGCKLELDHVFIMNEKNKVFISKREVFDVDLDKVRVNSLGMYFGELTSEFRPSIEGSQLIGPKAKKNVLELDEEEVKHWLYGEDIEKETDASGFVILKHGNDFLGSGKYKDGRVLNFVSKIRRIGTLDI